MGGLPKGARRSRAEGAVAAIDEDATGVEDGAHGAIGENWTAGEDAGKLLHSVDMLSHAGLKRHRAGLLCYTSVVITQGCTGFGPAFYRVPPVAPQPL